jgi:hypothetical protein
MSGMLNTHGSLETSLRIERIGIGRRAAVVVDCRIGPHLDHLPHRGMLGVRRSDVGLLLADHVEGHQGVAVDVGINGGFDRLDGARCLSLIRAGCERNCAGCRAANGHAAAAPPSVAKNFRRSM